MTALFTPGTSRQPQFKVAVGTNDLAGLVSCEVDQNSHYQADTFHATIALNAPGGFTSDQWGGDELTGKVFAVSARLNPTDAWVQLITGEADKVSVDVINGTVTVEGRDLTSRFIEAKTQETFLNKTASEVAAELASRHGMTAAGPATTTLVSRYYQQDHDKVTHEQFSKTSTEWDLLSFLAQQEGYDLFVVGTVLHFQPPETNAQTYTVTWNQQNRTADVISLSLDRSLTLAKDVAVVVRSWNSRQGRGFTKTSGKGSGMSVQSGKVQRYVYTRPNLTEDQAQKLADSLREQITRHERNIALELPVELSATPRDMIALSGCGGTWDMAYYIASIHRSFNEDGTSEHVAAKNHSPASETPSPG